MTRRVLRLSSLFVEIYIADCLLAGSSYGRSKASNSSACILLVKDALGSSFCYQDLCSEALFLRSGGISGLESSADLLDGGAHGSLDGFVAGLLLEALLMTFDC